MVHSLLLDAVRQLPMPEGDPRPDRQDVHGHGDALERSPSDVLSFCGAVSCSKQIIYTTQTYSWQYRKGTSCRPETLVLCKEISAT